MEFYDLVYHLAWKKDITIEKLSLGMGHSSAYIARQKSRGSLPNIDTAIKILDACDYVLCAAPKENVPDDVFVIDNPSE